MSSILGTPYYIAPEVIKGSYNQMCDVWSIGVITYCLLCGYPPFDADTEVKLFDKILKGKIEMPESDWKDISTIAKDFIFKTIEVNPKDRMKLEDALKHPWIVKNS